MVRLLLCYRAGVASFVVARHSLPFDLFALFFLRFTGSQICDHFGAFDILIANPSNVENFEEIYGSGAAAVVLRASSGVMGNRMVNMPPALLPRPAAVVSAAPIPTLGQLEILAQNRTWGPELDQWFSGAYDAPRFPLLSPPPTPLLPLSFSLSLSLSLAAPQICEHFDILIAKPSFAEKFDVIYGSGAASVVLRTSSAVVDNRMSNWLSHGTFTPPVPQPAVALAVPTRVADSPLQGVCDSVGDSKREVR